VRIGVDIDGVINDILTICVQKLNKHLNKSLTVKDITDYDFSKCYDVSYAEMHNFFVREEESILENVAPQETAAQVLQEIGKYHRVILITARPPSQREVTEVWLEKHNIPYDKLITIGSHDKREACRREKIELFIEDRLENALMINALGIPVLLMDAPHNRTELPAGITRVNCWQEIRLKLLGEMLEGLG